MLPISGVTSELQDIWLNFEVQQFLMHSNKCRNILKVLYNVFRILIWKNWKVWENKNKMMLFIVFIWYS